MRLLRGGGATNRRMRRAAARTTPRGRLSRAHRGADAAHRAREVVVHAQGWSQPVKRWTWDEFNALPQTQITTRYPLRHDVVANSTRPWRGVSIDDVFEAAELDPPTPFVLANSFDGYSTNVPLADLRGGKAMIGDSSTTASRLPPDHGGPARLLVPHLYFWKSAKYVSGLQFTQVDTRRASGNFAATTCAAIPGANSGTPAMNDLIAPSSTRWQSARVRASRSRRRASRASSSTCRADRRTSPASMPMCASSRPTATARCAAIRSPPPHGATYDRACDRAAGRGEVSPFFHDVVAEGDTIDLRGPLGGHSTGRP